MTDLTYQTIERAEEIDTLLGRTSRYGDFTYTYEPQTIALLKKEFEDLKSIYVLVREGETSAGFISCDTDWWEPDCFFIREIFVDPAFQRRGIDNKLMQTCIKHARSHTAQAVVTQTAFENIPMQHLCEKLGFVRFENPKWEEGITYKLVL